MKSQVEKEVHLKIGFRVRLSLRSWRPPQAPPVFPCQSRDVDPGAAAAAAVAGGDVGIRGL